VVDNLEEASKNIAAISNLSRGKELFCDKKDFVRSDDSFEPGTALLALRNKQNKDVVDEEEQEGGEAAARERKFVHMNRSFIASVK
jgi:hypothetical protein